MLSELDLASRWDDRPIVAITGTDGKTTVTTLVTAMLEASGRRAVACGNTEAPLVEAIADPAVETFVVEASSFRLGRTRRFRPRVAVWLNFAPDHLDVHDSLAGYEKAKAKVWSDLAAGEGIAVASAEDPVVLANRNPELETVTFGPEGSGADATVVDGVLHVCPTAPRCWRSPSWAGPCPTMSTTPWRPRWPPSLPAPRWKRSARSCAGSPDCPHRVQLRGHPRRRPVVR